MVSGLIDFVVATIWFDDLDDDCDNDKQRDRRWR